MTSPVEDEFTELVDADIPRVDLVDKAANGTTFLIAKQADGGQSGLLDPAVVRDLIGKSQPEPKTTEEKVTMTGSPGAIAKLIHEAALRRETADVAKAKYDTEDRKRMASNGQAMKDGSYPVADKADLQNAIHAVGRGKGQHNAIRRHIISRAKSLGASSEIPDNWAADGSLKEGSVSKVADGEMDEGMDGMDPTMPLACPDDEDVPGDPTDPGSPAWEAVDAATAHKWLAILARAKHAIDLLADREMMEAASGADPDDVDHACALQDACCAIDYAISVLAPFAVSEQAEADCAAAEMEAVGKALAAFDTGPLDTIEALAPIAKAGRVLSSANEAAIRGAVESLQKVLASLPQAPTADEEGGRPVAKTANEEPNMPEPTLTEDVTEASGQEPAMRTQQAEPKVDAMAKAKGDPQMVVYDQKGRLIGIVDPGDVTPVANSDSDADDGSDGSDDSGGDDTASDGGDDNTPETPDLEPAPAAEVGTPADAVSSDDDNVTKQTDEPTDDATSDDVLKSSILDMVKGMFGEHSATQAAQIATTGDAVLELAGLVKTLQGQVRALEEQPAEPKVFTNGAVPPREMLRGQDRGAQPVDVTKAAEMKKTLYRGTAQEQNQAALDMQTLAIARLQEIHHGGAQ